MAKINASNFSFLMRLFKASVFNKVQQSSRPAFGDIPALSASSFFAMSKLKPHSLAILSLNSYISGNLQPVSMWITGNGILPKKAFLQSHTVAVESLPVLQRQAMFLNWAFASLIKAILLRSSS